MKKNAAILICEFADAPLAVPGSIFDHDCAQCGRRLMIAPSGQKMLRENPELVTICKACYFADDSLPANAELAGTLEEISQECVTAIPNLRRTRN